MAAQCTEPDESHAAASSTCVSIAACVAAHLVLHGCQVHGRAAQDVLAQQQDGPAGGQQRLHDCQVAAHDGMVQGRAPLAILCARVRPLAEQGPPIVSAQCLGGSSCCREDRPGASVGVCNHMQQQRMLLLSKSNHHRTAQSAALLTCSSRAVTSDRSPFWAALCSGVSRMTPCPCTAAEEPR